MNFFFFLQYSFGQLFFQIQSKLTKKYYFEKHFGEWMNTSLEGTHISKLQS